MNDKGFYSNQNVVQNDLNQRTKVFQRQKSQKKSFPTENKKNTSRVWVVKTDKLDVKRKTKKN